MRPNLNLKKLIPSLLVNSKPVQHLVALFNTNSRLVAASFHFARPRPDCRRLFSAAIAGHQW